MLPENGETQVRQPAPPAKAFSSLSAAVLVREGDVF
jgi:hypothetical protein